MQAQTVDTADEAGNWLPENLARIHDRLNDIVVHATSKRPVAVFDFDNTCIFRDVGQAVFRSQVQHLRYRLTPEQLAAILPPPEGELAGRPMAAVTSTLCDAYQQLWPLIAASRQAEALRLPAYPLFATLLLWFTISARKDERLGPRYVLPFMGKMLAGFTTAELRSLAVEVVQEVGKEPLTDQTLRFDAPEPIGRIEASFPLGLHAFAEMRRLMHRLETLGIGRYVISASTEWLVEGAAQWLGFPVAAEHIFGIRVQLDGEERLGIEDAEAYPTTFREGKAEIIRQWIDGTPVLVAGDADTDFEMLTLPGVAIRLLINRRQTGLISTLYQDPSILLQGLDLTTGSFRPSRESIGN
jgi:phosphoserine phosphatase